MATHLDDRGNPVSDPNHNRIGRETPAEGRQGLLGKYVLMVLVGAVILAMLGWAMSGMYGEADHDGTSDVEQSSQSERGTDATPTGQKVIDNTPAPGEQTQTVPTDRDPTAESGTGGESQSVAPTGTEKTR